VNAASSLGERVARQETAEEARALIAAYGAVIDRQDPDALMGLLDARITLTVPGYSWNGVEEVIGFFASHWSEYPNPRRHFITNVAMVRLTADEAEATSSFLFVSASGEVPTLGWGTYRDTFVRRDGKLRFKSKHIEVELEVDVRTGWARELQGVPS